MKEKKQENFKIIPVGNDMIDLINKIKGNFFKEYQFHPTSVDITNLIASRVKDNNLF